MRLITFLPAAAVAAWASDELFGAAGRGDANAVKVALDAGVPVDAKWRNEQTPLFACFRGHADMVRLLLERGARPDVKETFYGMTAVGVAGQKGNAEIVAMLLEKVRPPTTKCCRERSATELPRF